MRGGILNGYDLGAVQAAASALPELAEAEAALRRALAGGATEFERLEGTARFVDGRATLDGASLSTEGGAVVSVTGTVDLGRGGGALDLRFAARPVAEAPEIGLRVAGAARRAAALARTRAVPALAGGAVGAGPAPDGASPYYLTVLLSCKATCLCARRVRTKGWGRANYRLAALRV